MLSLFRKKEPQSRKELRLEFEAITADLHKAKELDQVSVGYGINMATAAFLSTFSSVEGFSNRPHSEQLDYLKKLSSAEGGVSNQDPLVALGFGLFKMWVGAIAAKDEELAAQFSEQLKHFSRIGDIGA